MLAVHWARGHVWDDGREMAFGDGQLFSNVNAAYNGSCERRLPNPMSFAGASTEPTDAPERPTLFGASLESSAFIVSTPPGDPGRSVPQLLAVSTI